MHAHMHTCAQHNTHAHTTWVPVANAKAKAKDVWGVEGVHNPSEPTSYVPSGIVIYHNGRAIYRVSQQKLIMNPSIKEEDE